MVVRLDVMQTEFVFDLLMLKKTYVSHDLCYATLRADTLHANQ